MSDVTSAPASGPDPVSPSARGVARPRWLDPRFVAGVALVLLAGLGCARLVASADHRVAVVAARSAQAAGTVLTSADLVVERAELPGHSAGYATAIGPLIGQRLNRAVGAGELIPSDAVAPAPPTATVVIELGAGLSPKVSAGQRIAVWVATKTCPAQLLLPDVVAQAVQGDTVQFGQVGGQAVSVALPGPAADQVVRALAVDGVEVRAAVLTGQPAPTPAAAEVSSPSSAPAGSTPSVMPPPTPSAVAPCTGGGS